MLDNGWIKLHRKLLCNPIVCKDAEHLAVWVYLLLQATHEERQAIFNGEKITLSAGQLLTSRNKIANKLKISSSKVYRILECLKNEQAIEQVTDNRQSLITLNNWELYQCDSEQVIEQQVNNQARKKGKEQEKFSPHTPFLKEEEKENKEYGKNEINTTTTTRTCEDDVLFWREIYKHGISTGCCLLISNNQLSKLATQLSESEMDYYIDKVSAMVECGYKFTCSHYEYILKLVEEDRKVS
jgi:DNA-binding transcriptional regulator YhcF (GntR family)